MQTKSIHLTDEEAASLGAYVTVTGEAEAAILKRAVLRGLADLRLEQGILAYVNGEDAAAAAEVAGMPRAIFLQALIDRGISILDGPPLGPQLEYLADSLGSDRLAAIARKLQEQLG
jgi:hypothetical protein